MAVLGADYFLSSELAGGSWMVVGPVARLQGLRDVLVLWAFPGWLGASR